MNKKVKYIIGFMVLIVFVFSCFLYFFDRRDYHKMNLSEVKSVYVNKTGVAVKLEETSAKQFLNIIKKTNTRLLYTSDDYFNNKNKEYVVSLVKGENDSQLLYIFDRNGEKYFYAPGSGTFKLSRNNYERILGCFPSFIDEDVSDFYNEEILSKYRKITLLPFNYEINDNDSSVVVISFNDVKNKERIKEFEENVRNKKFAFMRIMIYDGEGGRIFYDIKYSQELGKVFVLKYNVNLYYGSSLERKEYLKVFYEDKCINFYNENINEEDALTLCM